MNTLTVQLISAEWLQFDQPFPLLSDLWRISQTFIWQQRTTFSLLQNDIMCILRLRVIWRLFWNCVWLKSCLIGLLILQCELVPPPPSPKLINSFLNFILQHRKTFSVLRNNIMSCVSWGWGQQVGRIAQEYMLSSSL